jgi:hypothetical protein
MRLEFIALDKLHRSRSTMRFAKKASDVSDTRDAFRGRRPSIRTGGASLLVGAAESFGGRTWRRP